MDYILVDKILKDGSDGFHRHNMAETVREFTRYGCHGYHFLEIKKEDIQNLLDGKILVITDGEYSTFIEVENE